MVPQVEWVVARRAAALLALVVLAASAAGAQTEPRRFTTIAALQQFPGFFHLQSVVLRGEIAEDGTSFRLRATA
jgi:hypothetical protein